MTEPQAQSYARYSAYCELKGLCIYLPSLPFEVTGLHPILFLVTSFHDRKGVNKMQVVTKHQIKPLG